MALTKLDALIAELEPYTVSGSALRKALADAGVETEAYDPAADKRTIAIAAIRCLRKLTVLSSDSLGKSSQGYNTDELRKRIKALCRENGLELSDFDEVSEISDGSKIW